MSLLPPSIDEDVAYKFFKNEDLSNSKLSPISSSNGLVKKQSSYSIDDDKFEGMRELTDIIDDLQSAGYLTKEKKIELDMLGTTYELGTCLGVGSMGKVFIATNFDTTEQIAVKRLKFDRLKIHRIRMEIEILKKVDHENIVNFLCVTEKSEYFYIAMEYLAGGELFDYVRGDSVNDISGIHEIEAAFIIKQVLNAIAYLHSNNIIHRDIKLENILLLKKKHFPIVKLTDFGLSKIIDNKTLKRHTSCGSFEYISPEVMLDRPYGQKSDMWSFGVTSFCMVMGLMPFYSVAITELRVKIILGVYSWEDGPIISNECKLFIGSFIRVDPNDRPSAEESLKNEWLIRSSCEAEKEIKIF